MSSPADRSAALDTVRVLGFVAVIVGHVWVNETTVHLFYPWHMPLYFVLAGYLWKPGRALASDITRRAASLLRPYLFWLALLLVLLVARGLTAGTLTADSVIEPLYGGFYARMPFTTFWFMTVFFGACVWVRLLERLPVMAQALVHAGGLSLGYVIGVELAKTPLSLGSLLPCAAFVGSGMALRHVRPHIGEHAAIVGVGLSAVSVVLVATGLSAPMDIKWGDYGTPFVSAAVGVMVSAGLVLVAEALLTRVPAPVSLATHRLAAAGLAVVLSHPAILWLLGTTPEGSWVHFTLAVVIPFAIGLVALRTRAAGWVTGSPRTNSRSRIVSGAHRA